MWKKSPPPAPPERCSNRPDYYEDWKAPCRKRRTYVRDLCVVSVCLTFLFVAADALGYL